MRKVGIQARVPYPEMKPIARPPTVQTKERRRHKMPIASLKGIGSSVALLALYWGSGTVSSKSRAITTPGIAAKMNAARQPWFSAK